jgi:hypothetical protein
MASVDSDLFGRVGSAYMMGVVGSSWITSNVGAGFAWQILVDLYFGSYKLVEISCIHHLLLYKVVLIMLIEAATTFQQ